MCPQLILSQMKKARTFYSTLLFSDPTNLHRRLITFLISDCILPDIIAHFSYIDWRTFSDEEYDKLLAFCLKKKLGSPSINLDAGVQTFNPGYYQDSKQGTLVSYFPICKIPPPSNWQDFESLCCNLGGKIWKDPDTKKNGRQAQPQNGV